MLISQKKLGSIFSSFLLKAFKIHIVSLLNDTTHWWIQLHWGDSLSLEKVIKRTRVWVTPPAGPGQQENRKLLPLPRPHPWKVRPPCLPKDRSCSRTQPRGSQCCGDRCKNTCDGTQLNSPCDLSRFWSSCCDTVG